MAMARRTRSSLLAVLLLAAAVATLLAPAFVQQPWAAKAGAAEVAGAVGALSTLAGALPAEAYSFKGPLTGSEVCTSKPLVWFIYPLCDPIFITSPLYLFPVLLIVVGGGITVLNLLIPATQPDEDLR
mmetsp:Transcript_79665/g.204949  ORF Transcript_79665/g.204949 Transcript_79665/m.204949 type:complete len:128 (-) Transcript_79665:94-477(-)